MSAHDPFDLEPKTGIVHTYDVETARGIIVCGLQRVTFYLTTFKGNRVPVAGEFVTVYFNRDKNPVAIFPRSSS